MTPTTTAKRKRNAATADDYMSLLRRFPPRPIRSAADYERAMGILRELTARADQGLTLAESDYADVLASLVLDYDQRHSSLLRQAARQKLSPVQALKALMDEHQMNTVGLGKLVGGSGQASMILSGKRELSKSNIRALAAHFNVSPALFI